MTVFAVTAATGQLGRLVIAALLESGVAPADVVAIARDPSKAPELAASGVTVRTGDYARAADWTTALAGVDRLLLVSGNELGQRVAQHGTVIDAAKDAGVHRVVYTSAPRADTTELILAPEHKATEELVRASGLPFTILRNGWYTENYLAQLPQYLEHGAIVGAAGQGRVSAAARADYAAAAAGALLGDASEFETGLAYELGGSTSFTLAEFAAAVTEVTGTPVAYRDLPAADFTAFLVGTGLDEASAGFVTALDEATARGDLEINTGDLERLIGRPTTPLVEVLRAN
jgi:NAD(P)H dehydrogenase (quinone)